MTLTLEELQQEIVSLKKEVAEIRAELNFYKLDRRIQKATEEHDYYFYLDNNAAICPHCWDNDHKITPVSDKNENGYFTCERCGYQGVYDHEQVDKLDDMQTAIFKKLFDDK